jgi:hypothetical protein
MVPNGAFAPGGAAGRRSAASRMTIRRTGGRRLPVFWRRVARLACDAASDRRRAWEHQLRLRAARADLLGPNRSLSSAAATCIGDMSRRGTPYKKTARRTGPTIGPVHAGRKSFRRIRIR